MTTLYDFELDRLNGKPESLEAYKGKVVLVVNTASKCGLTPQYEGLEALYKELKGDGLVILGFPCNQFGEQEKGSGEEISEFCQINYGVSFPMFSKIEVNGSGTHPLYQHLKSEKKGVLRSEKIKWNFTKFLVGRDGKVVKRFAPMTKPAAIKSAISKLL